MAVPKSVYSPLKIFHQRDAIDSLRSGKHCAPVHVQCIITNICDSWCRFCSYRQPGYSSNETFNPKDEIPYETLQEIVADCAQMGVKAIEVTGGGEPTCHPHFIDFCRLVLDAGIDLGLVTNGGRWSPEHTATLTAAKWIRYSVDAGCRNTYAMIRSVRPERYDKVRETIRNQCAAPNRDRHQLIGVGFVVTADNWSEVLTAAENAKADGADNFRISAVFQNEGARYFDGFGMEAAKLCHEAERLADDKFTVFNLFGDRVSDLREGQPDFRTCWFSRLCTYIGADLNVYRCCVVSFNRIGLLGSLADQSFREFWFSPSTENKLKSFDAHSCPRCMFTRTMKTIDYALDPDPPHANFL